MIVYLFICMYCTCMFVSLYMRVYVSVHMHVCMCVSMYVCMCISAAHKVSFSLKYFT